MLLRWLVAKMLVGTRLLRVILPPGLLGLWDIRALNNWRGLLWHWCSLRNIRLYKSCYGLRLIRSIRLHYRWLWWRLRGLIHRLLRTLLLLLMLVLMLMLMLLLLLLLLLLMLLLLLLPLKILRASIAVIRI